MTFVLDHREIPLQNRFPNSCRVDDRSSACRCGCSATQFPLHISCAVSRCRHDGVFCEFLARLRAPPSCFGIFL